MKGTEGKERLVVVGGGMSAVAFLEELTRLDAGRYEITLFSGERHLNYNRVLLSQVLTEEKTIEEITLHQARWFEERGIEVRTGCRVSEIRRASRTVVGEDGQLARYNKLVLSTGSLPVVLPVPGSDKAGVVTFRNIGDCERIKGLLSGGGEGARKAVVIGGGLLGLEAAHALKDLGAEVTVVHLPERLMERQLDPLGAGLLKEDLEAMGIKVLLEKKTVEITGNARATGVRFEDGSSVEADLVVMSVGIRPNAELAMASGIYCRKGIVVTDTMQTYDPAVYAIGECVEHRGATFGLVASVFEQARVLANHLAGDSRLVFKDKPASTTLKVPGVNLYAAGDVEVPGGETIEYSDRGAKVYKRLVLSGGRVRGIVLYGDTQDGPSLFRYLLEGSDVSDMRGRLLFGGTGRESPSVDDIPDDAVVCGCNGVTKGMIVEAIEKKGLFTREDVRRETNASGSCGGCAPMVDRILEAVLGGSFEGSAESSSICPCTTYSRDDVIKNIRERGLRSVQEVMDTLGWESVGCEACRPAINYYVSMVWPSQAEEDNSSRLINERVHANIQKDGTFSVVPRVYGGAITPAELKRIADAAVKYRVPLVKITGGQRIDLLGVKKEDLPGVWSEIDMPSGHAYGKAMRTVKTCVGDRFCRYGTQDSLGLGVELEKMLEGLWMPAKVKMGVTGCPRNCAETSIKDVGVNGITGGWEVYAGGCGGIELKAAELLATVKTAEEVKEIVSAFLQLYREEAAYGERTYRWVRRRGLKAVKEAVVEDRENRKDLVARLKEALHYVSEPWKERTGGKLSGESFLAGQV